MGMREELQAELAEAFDDPDGLADAVRTLTGNALSFSVFNSMSTQWRTGMGGATGLDYAALPVVMELLNVEQDDRKRVFADVRFMEQEALGTMADHKD